MTGTISMETENVMEVASLFFHEASTLQSLVDELWASIQKLDSSWQGGGKEQFIIDSFHLRMELLSQYKELYDLEKKLVHEVQEWESADRKLGTPDNTKNKGLFVQGRKDLTAIHPSDITQSTTLGDCYLIAGMGAVAATNPDLIRQMIKINPDGSYTIRFFNEQTGLAEYVLVSPDELPRDENGNLIHAQAGDYGELWPALIEKAYAKWIDERNIRDPWWSKLLESIGFEGKEDYQQIEGGLSHIAIQQMTGGVPTVYNPPINFSETDLLKSLENGNAITFGTLDKSDPNLLSNPMYIGNNAVLHNNHAYYITAYDPISKLVEVHNPWGWNQAGISIRLDDLIKNIREIRINELPK